MSNKPFNKLSDIEQRLLRCFPTEMWNNGEELVSINLIGGFELWNTRPYHNYETWSCGWHIKTGERYGNIEVSAEDLDDAVGLLEKKLEQFKLEKAN